MRKHEVIQKLQEENKEVLECKNISQYLEIIRELVGSESNRIVVYRGEPQIYDVPCRPNIFRKGVLNSNRFYERSLFDSMRQNGLTTESRYLDNAIDAQHGEFPSRLLDVTYNCMIALYFAVTAYYHRGDDADDDKDGMVYIFFIDDIYSPSAQNTNQAYDAIINKDVSWFNDKIIFEKNHKFVDHCKINKRIVAQQGAFILFQGNDASPVPKYMQRGIRIPQEYKKNLRKELKLYFGIHTGSIYPEITNLPNELSEKSKKIINTPFSCEYEFDQVIATFEKEIDYYFDYLCECKKKLEKAKADKKEQAKIKLDKEEQEYYEALLYVEQVINSYRIGLIEYGNGIKETCFAESEKETYKNFNNAVEKYNKILDEFGSDMENQGQGNAIETENLRIKI